MIESRAQVEIDFTVGISEQYPELMDVIRAACDPANAGQLKKVTAAECDWSPSELARAINEHADRPLKVADLPRLLEALPRSRHMVIEWLIEMYYETSENRVKRAADLITTLGPALLEAAETLRNHGPGIDDPPRPIRRS